MTIRFAKQTEIETWNKHILENPDRGNVFQGYEFSQQKKLGGWRPRYIIIGKLAVTILEKNVFGVGVLWYIPKGPGVTSMHALDELLPSLRQFAATNNVFAIKIEPELLKTNETLSDTMKLHLIRVAPIQPNFSTVTLDISQNIDVVMSQITQKARHAIRRAERDGVIIRRVPVTDENSKIMYKLLTQTAENQFRIRSYNYYNTFWKRYSDADLGQLFFAYVDSTVVAGAYAITFGTKSTYKDGASLRQRSVYGASHLLQWQVIRWAKSKGAILHDFCGSPPSDQINNPKHPHYGIGRFKTSFNKQVTDYIGAYDVVVKPLKYKLWVKIGERLVRRLHTYRYHENYY